MSQDVFIAHASADSRLAMRLARAIEARNWRCWLMARDFKGGVDGQPVIDAALRHSRVVAVILSAEAYASDEVERELAFAKSSNIPIAAITIEPGRAPRRFTTILGKSPHFDAQSPAFDSMLESMVAFVAGVMARQPEGGKRAQAAPVEFHSFGSSPHAAKDSQPARHSSSNSRHTPMAGALAAALAAPPVTAPRKTWAYLSLFLAITGIAGALVIREISTRQARLRPEDPGPRVSPQMKPAVTQAVAGLFDVFDRIAARQSEVASAVDLSHFAVKSEADAKAADLAAEFAELASRRRELEVARDFFNSAFDDSTPTLEPLLQRGAEVSVLMKFRGRLKDAAAPELVVRALDRSIEELGGAPLATLADADRVRRRTTNAMTLHDAYCRLAYVLGRRLIEPARSLWPTDASERLMKLAKLGPTDYETPEHMLIAATALENEAARLEESLQEDLAQPTVFEPTEKSDVPETPVNATVTAPEKPAVESGDVSWRSLINDAIEARDKNELERCLAIFKRYGEHYRASDPTAEEYVRHALAFSPKITELGVRGGLYVAAVRAESSAAKDGLLVGDILVLYDDVEVRTFDGWKKILENAVGRHRVKVEILRLGADGGFEKKSIEIADDASGADIVPI